MNKIVCRPLGVLDVLVSGGGGAKQAGEVEVVVVPAQAQVVVLDVAVVRNVVNRVLRHKDCVAAWVLWVVPEPAPV